MLKKISLTQYTNLKYVCLNFKHFLISPLNLYFFLPSNFFFSIKNKSISFLGSTLETKKIESRFVSWLKHCSRPYKKKLVLQGLGFKATLNSSRDKIEFKLGFSHPIIMLIPKFICITQEKSILSLTSANPVLLGNFIYQIRLLKKLNVYKGKGIIYNNETFILKEIKKT
jgi:ribosomal protein L6P/L9E